MKYRAYRTKSDNLFHFQFTNDLGEAVFSGGPFNEKESCFEAIRTVMNAAGNPANYSQETSNGTNFFTINSGGKQLAKSVSYNSAAEANAGAALSQKEAPSAVAKGAAPAAAKSTEGSAKTTSTKSSSSSSDDYKPLAYYESRISGVKDGFDKFEGDGEYYFTYNLDGMVVLISEGYSSEKGRDNGVASVTKNMVLDERYQREIHSNGKHFFNLKAGNHQEIATSRWFNDLGDSNNAIGLLTSGGKGGGKMKSMFSAGSKGGAIYPDYKPLDFYQSRVEGIEFGFDSFEDDSKSYFTINQNNEPLLISETYQSVGGRDKGIASVKKNVKKEERYVKERHPNGKYYFRLLAGNKQEIATSKWFDTGKERDRAISWLLGTGGTRRRKKATRTKTEPGERVYVNQGLSYPCSDITYDTFQSGGNKKYYFVFKDKEGKAILINGDVRGYATPEDAAAAIELVKKYGPDPKNYFRKVSKTGKHYFFIRDENEKSVARGSLFYSDEEKMEANIKSLACGAGMAAGGGASAKAATSNAVVDDYLPCEAYAGDEGFHTFQNEDSKEFYFAYNDGAAKTFLRSEGYTSASGRDNGIESVKKNAPLDERWSFGTALNDKYHYYTLKAGNHQEIARSCYYKSEAEMKAGYEWVRGGDSMVGKGAAMFAGAWMTGNAISSRKSAEEAKEREAAAAAAAKKKAEEEAAAAALAAKQKAEDEAKAKAAAAKKKAEDEAAAAKAASSSAVVDDYLPCEAYSGAEGFHTFQDENSQEYYFAYNNGSGKTFLRSEGYKAASGRDNGIESVKKNSSIDERWSFGTALNDKYHYYSLKAGNNQEIARSCYYKSESEMKAAYDWVRGGDSMIGKGAAMFAGAWMTGSAIASRKSEEEAKAAAKKKADEEAMRLKAAEDAKAKEAAAAAAAATAAAAALAKKKAAEEAEAKRLVQERERIQKEKAAEEKRLAAIAEQERLKEEARLKAAADAEKTKAAALAAAAAAAAATAASKINTDKKEPKKVVAAAATAAKGATAGAAATTAAATGGGFGWLKWLLPILLILGLLWFLKGCDGCKSTPPPPPPPVTSEVVAPPAPKAPLCANGDGLGLTPGSMEFNMANFLADPEHSFPKSFGSDEIVFSRGSTRLNTKARKQLDNVAAVMKECSDARMDITGFISGEKGTYRGSKEVSLGDVRAREAYNYLIKKLGVPESRLNFSGGGTNDKRTLEFTFNR